MATSKVMRSRISDHLTNNNSNSNKTLQHSMSIGNDNDNDNGDDNNTTTTTTATVTIPPPVFRQQKTAEEVWQEIVAGNHNQKQLKQEAHDDDFDDVDADEHNDNAMMTLEDFLAKAEAVDDDDDDANHELKMPQPLMFSFGSGPLSPFQMNESGSGAARGRGAKKRGIVSESLDKVSQQRQRRMIKNRESAARSRERKQAYQAELEGLAVKLEEENQQLLREKAQRTKDRYKLLMEKLVPIVEKQKTVRILRKVQSMQW